MDLLCTTCREPWDAHHLRHDAIFDGETLTDYDRVILEKFDGDINGEVAIKQPPCYHSIVFMQNDGADEALAILDKEGEKAAIEHLKQWDNGEYHDEPVENPWGTSDDFFNDGKGYVLSYNTRLGYIGLCIQAKDEPKIVKWRTIFERAGYTFGSSLYVVKTCPCCKPEDELDEEMYATKEAVAQVLGDDHDGLISELENL